MDAFAGRSAFEGDSRNEWWTYRFSETVRTIRVIAELSSQHREAAVVECLAAIDASPAPSLYRALLLQLLEIVFAGKSPRPCAGCGKWFTETEDESTARHIAGWKRSDARYHSSRCLKAAKARTYRARKKTGATAVVTPIGRIADDVRRLPPAPEASF